MKNMVFFEPKSWWKDYIYWLLKSSCFELFGDGKYGLFLSQEVDGKMIFTGYWEVLVLNFSVMGNTVFFSVKKLMERWYLLGLFELSMIFQDLGHMVFCTVLVCDTATAKNMGWLWWLLQWWWSYWVVRGLSKARLGSTDRETVNAYYLASITLVGWYFVEDERKETKKLLE